MLDQNAITSVFRKRLLQMPGIPDEDTGCAWENLGFTPPQPQSLWVRERMVWGMEMLRALDVLEQNGQVLYDLNFPKGKSTEEVRAFAKQVADWFPPQRPQILAKLLPSGINVSILRTEALQGMQAQINSQVWYVVTIRITFKALGGAPPTSTPAGLVFENLTDSQFEALR